MSAMTPAFSTGAALPARGFLAPASSPLARQPSAVAARPRRCCAAVTPAMSLRDSAGRALAVGALAALVALAPAADALAARGGGRVGGSNFRSPAQQVVPAGGGGVGYGGGYGYGGGGMMFGPSMMFSPFMYAPLAVGGAGSLGTVVLVGGGALLAYRALAERREEQEFADQVNPNTAVVTIKVGLLATARQLQVDLDSVARSADTESVDGLRYVLEEAVLSLLRNPDRWVYGSVSTDVGRLSESEDKFNRACMAERLKIGEETLSNVRGRTLERGAATPADPLAGPSEYIVVSLVAAATDEGLSKELPEVITSAADMNRALGMLGGVSAENLQGVEIVWAPQNKTDTLTEEEMLADHPELRRI